MKLNKVNHWLGDIKRNEDGIIVENPPLTPLQAIERTADKYPVWYVDKGQGYGTLLMHFGPGKRKFDFALCAVIDGEIQVGTALTRTQLIELYNDLGEALIETRVDDDTE